MDKLTTPDTLQTPRFLYLQPCLPLSRLCQTRSVMMEKGRKMMEFSKEVLHKVSFDRLLFKKELIKARKWVGQQDQLVLKAWALATFGHLYKDVIMEVFQTTVRT